MERDFEISTDDVAKAIEEDGWIVDIAKKRHVAHKELSLDEIFKVNLEFICKHWHMKPYEVTYQVFDKVMRKVYASIEE